jgi:hypothetical protein
MKTYKSVPIFESKVLCDRKRAHDEESLILNKQGYIGCPPMFFHIKGPHGKYIYSCETPRYGQAWALDPKDALKMMKTMIDRG